MLASFAIANGYFSMVLVCCALVDIFALSLLSRSRCTVAALLLYEYACEYIVLLVFRLLQRTSKVMNNEHIHDLFNMQYVYENDERLTTT